MRYFFFQFDLCCSEVHGFSTCESVAFPQQVILDLGMSNNHPVPSQSYPVSSQIFPSPSSWSADGNCSRLPELIAGIQSGKLLHLTELKLAGCGLTEIPAEISQLTMLEKFDAGGNSLSDLPASFANLISLRILFFLNNRFTAVPEVSARTTQCFTLRPSSPVNTSTEICGQKLGPSAQRRRRGRH